MSDDADSAADLERAAGRAFGATNRERLLTEFLDACGSVGTDTAWMRVYELLLWIDRTTSLAHCYESDKCQPGRPWYGRSLAFHDWLCDSFGVDPNELSGRIDWLFRQAVTDLASTTPRIRAKAATKQRVAYEARGFPKPGAHPDLVSLISESLSNYLLSDPGESTWRILAERIHTLLGEENKRKNLLGEGFEDALAAIIRRLPGAESLVLAPRALLGGIPGFHPQGNIEKHKRVDLAIWDPEGARRLLVTAKWSIRADREEQFSTDCAAYVRANVGAPFEYVLVTNEFDAARLVNACDRLEGNAQLFSNVVHVNTAGVLAAYGTTGRGSALRLPDLAMSRRLISLEQWLSSILS